MTSKRRRNGCILTAFFGTMIAASAGMAYLVISVSTPAGSPLAQMYRAEAGLAALATAVESYRAELGVYPPAGDDGLSAAMRHISRKADYMPGDRAVDSWDQPYVYVPHTQYADAGSQAVSGADGFFNPTSFQLYSIGMDGDAGGDAPAKRQDNITNWDDARSWRDTYQRRHKDFFLKKGTRQ